VFFCVFFSWQKGLNAKDIHKEMFTLGSVCRVKQFILGGKRFADDEEVETEVRKWLRQQSKHFYAAGFDALVKRGTSVSRLVEDMSRNKRFFLVRMSHVLRFMSICDLFTDSPSYF
jgi:hypothetical protein